jgi:hypothetical protein
MVMIPINQRFYCDSFIFKMPEESMCYDSQL